MNARLLLAAASLSLVLGFAVGYLQPAGTSRDLSDDTSTSDANLSEKVAGTNEHPHFDFEQSLTEAVSHPSRLHREHDLIEILDRLSPEDFPHVANALLRVPVEARSEMLEVLYSYWAAKDPAAACQYALSQEKYMSPIDADMVIAIWMEADPTGLVAWMRQRSNSERLRMSYSIYRAASSLNKADFGTLMPLVLESCSYRYFDNELPKFFRKWSAEDLHQAAAEALAIRHGRLRSAAIDAVAQSWAERDPRGALLWISNVSDPRLQQRVEANILSVWAETDPAAAATYAQSMPDTKAQQAALAKIAIGMLKKDPAAASSFADSIPLSEFPEDGFYAQWAQIDPYAASEAYVRRLTELEPEKRKPFEDRVTQLFRNWSEKEPKAAAEFAFAQTEGIREELIDQAAASWTDKDRTAAVEWGMNLPEGSAREAALRSIATRWAMFSTNEAASWLESLPTGSSRDAAVAGFVKTTLRTDAEGALMWARTIPDPQKSADALVEGWFAWVQLVGLVEATRWLKSAQGLTPLERASVEKAERSTWLD